MLDPPGPTANYPRLLPGYMSMVQQPLTIYKCEEASHCPGGRPGSCGFRRDPTAVACAECSEGFYEDAADDCEECQGWQTIAMLCTAPIVMMIALAVLAWAANKERIAEANASASCAIVAGLTCTSIQTMTVLGNLEIDWAEPLKSCINIISLIGFDIKIIGIGCLIDGGSGTFLMRQLVAPGLAAWLLIISLLKKRFFHKKLEVTVHFANAAGSLFMLVFISIVLSAVTPLICYRHPGDGGESMTSDPAVLCFDSEVHSTMLAVGMVSLAGIAGPFFALVLWATIRYPTFVKMSTMSNSRQLRRFYFLFRRFQPHGYYYAALLLTRSLMICLVPVAFRDNGPAHLLLLSGIMACFLLIQSIIRPWRGDVANALDSTISILIIMLLVCGALNHTDRRYVESTISAFAHVCLVLFLLVLFAALSWAVVQRSRPSPFYHRFVCHHKAAAAAQARLLQLLLQLESDQSCFLDSDDLTNLDELFDTVRARVGRLIVYMTADILKRPWCVGEITTAYKSRVKVTKVITPSFEKPEDAILDDPLAGYMDPIGKEFAEAGLVVRDLIAALKWVLSCNVPSIHINREQVGTNRLVDVTQELLKDAKVSAARRAQSRRSAKMPGQGSILLSSESGNEEATAVAGILSVLLQQWALNKTGHMLYVLSDMPEVDSGELSLSGLHSLFQSSYAAIVVLTAGSLTSHQLSSIVISTEVQEKSQGYDMLHVATPEFQFPTNDFYEATMPRVLVHGLDKANAKVLLQSFFRKISVRFTPSASRQILESEAVEIRKRMLRERKYTDTDFKGSTAQGSRLIVATKSDNLKDVTDMIHLPEKRNSKSNAALDPLAEGSGSFGGSHLRGVKDSDQVWSYGSDGSDEEWAVDA